ncbi:MAG TPA: flagellar biosynthesis repressor FlbT [Roseomonas sp.]|jgi:flagellar protein FlbT
MRQNTENPTPSQGRLVLDLRAGDRMLVNGAALQFKTRTSVMLGNHARFLFGKQIMSQEDARTPARRIYFAIQAAYVAEDAERPAYIVAARELTDEYSAATTSDTARAILVSAIAALERGDCWEAMRGLRRLFAHDDAVLALTSDP